MLKSDRSPGILFAATAAKVSAADCVGLIANDCASPANAGTYFLLKAKRFHSVAQLRFGISAFVPEL
jgi:hypothetical protein